MKQSTQQHHTHREKGQSLVEVALFLPIFIIILAGLIEVSQLVITQNRVSQAARVSSRFGANGGQDEGMMIVALNSVTQTLLMDEGNWDMWVVRGTVNDDGDDFSDWEFNHVYGISNTLDFTQVNEAEIQTEILTDLQSNMNPSDYASLVGGMQVVGLYTLHDIESILGLDAMPWLQGFYTIRGFSFMRQTGETVVQTNGCTAFPIAVHEDIRSVNPPGSGGNPYPPASEFTGPANPPAYTDFIYHTPDVPLSEAHEGDVYLIYNGFGTGNFGWLLWNTGQQGDANTLNDSMSWPGDSNDYTNAGNCNNNCVTPLYPHDVRGYVNPDDTSDISLQIGDWIPANTGVSNSSAIRTTLNGHIGLDRQLRVIVWGESRQQGSNGAYRVSGFAVFRLHGYSLQHSWILAEFIRWDTSCGQPLE
ncbi:MAG: pilus assembly protein [Anaerolineales bacterium]|nr:pilus assembly protein [Anaerolineales bacterium]